MPVTNYYSVEGEIIGEATGGVRTDYLTDALGSVTGTVNQSASVVNTYRYKPYGATLAKTGTGADPIFGWVGSQGYAGTGKAHSEVYVRARHYSSTSGRWTTKDPLGFDGGDWNLYRYVGNSAVDLVDYFGLQPQLGKPKSKHPGRRPPSQKQPRYPVSPGQIVGPAKNILSGCFGSKDGALLAEAFDCLAFGESTRNAYDQSGMPFGLFNIGTKDFQACQDRPKDKKGKKLPTKCTGNYWNVQCQIETATRKLMDLCGNKPNYSAWQALGMYWGVVPGDGVRKNPKEQNQQFLNCLKDKKITPAQLKNISCKPKGSNCPGCDYEKCPEHHAIYPPGWKR